MKDRILKTGAALALILTLVASVLPLGALAEGGTLYITGYTVEDSSGKGAGSITKGSVVNITVSVKDTSDGTGGADPKALDITKLDDSFSGGSVQVDKTSPEGRPLVYAVKFSNIKYKGAGQSLRFQIGRAGEPDSYQTMEVTITEAVVYDPSASTPPPTPEAPPEPIPAPMVVVYRSEMEKPIEAGQEMDLTITFRNLGGARLRSPVATFTPSDSLNIVGGTSSFVLDDINSKKSGSVTLRIRANSTIPSPNQSLGVELKFNYDNNVSLVQGSITDKVSIPALGRESVPQPPVLVTRSALGKPISPGQALDVTVSFQNAGTTKLVSPVATVTPSDSLVVLNETSTFLLPDIAPGATGSITVRVKALQEISSTNQSLGTELKFGYDNGGMLTQATVSDRVNLAATPPSKTDTPVPNLVIQKFSYGEGSVPAGGKFPLGIVFQNTGTVKVENVVVTVDGGESFTMDGSTNTFYYKALGAGSSQTLTVPMQAVPASKSGAQSIGVSFKYEYLDGEKRTPSTADIKISVPVYQPDRFQINAPAVPESMTVGEEAEVTLAYVNKGKDDIANVEATVEGDGVDTPARTQYLGNITAGTSGTIGFALTPTAAGETEIVLKISYEDADQQVQTRTFPVKLQAEEMVPMDDYPDVMEEDPSGGIPWLWIGLGGAVLAAAAVVVILRKKVSRSAEGSWDGSWEETEETPKEEA
nr:hypothetical protein [uncultured Oscillibacter sp.]